jgi:hypothetical protein
VLRLRLALDARYPQIVAETKGLLGRCFPTSSIGAVRADAGAAVMVFVYSSHLACLFPQHGRGKKHERRIALEDWQQELLAEAPWSFLRGCIQSDGCSFVNRTGPYAYLTYDFCNYSADIRQLFTATCDHVGVRYRATGHRVRVNRRQSVALMEAHIGIKA